MIHFFKEVKIIFPEDDIAIEFQRMILKKKERKKNIELNGVWENVPFDGTAGKIYFIKRK